MVLCHSTRPLGSRQTFVSERISMLPTTSARQSVISSSAAVATLPLAGSAEVSYCPHPDALKRRQEFERMRRERENERLEASAKQEKGLKWWEGERPANMCPIQTRQELMGLLKEAKHQNKLAVVNYFTEDCYTCRSLHPKLKKIASDNPDVIILKVNGSNQSLQCLFEEQGIRKVPLFQFVRAGQVKSEFTASLNPEKLAKLRKEIAVHKNDTSHEPGPSPFASLDRY